MWIFNRRTRPTTLSTAALAGDLKTVRKLLRAGADPNARDPGDDSYPLHYALNHGPQLVQLLVDHGAGVSVPSRGATPLAKAESRGFDEIAAILRKAGATLTEEERSPSADPRLRHEIEPIVSALSFQARTQRLDAGPLEIAVLVERQFLATHRMPTNLSPEAQLRLLRDIHTIIQEHCGLRPRRSPNG